MTNMVVKNKLKKVMEPHSCLNVRDLLMFQNAVLF